MAQFIGVHGGNRIKPSTVVGSVVTARVNVRCIVGGIVGCVHVIRDERWRAKRDGLREREGEAERQRQRGEREEKRRERVSTQNREM